MLEGVSSSRSINEKQQHILLANPASVTCKYHLRGATRINTNLKINTHICARLPQHARLIEIQLLSSSPPWHA